MCKCLNSVADGHFGGLLVTCYALSLRSIERDLAEQASTKPLKWTRVSEFYTLHTRGLTLALTGRVFVTLRGKAFGRVGVGMELSRVGFS
jgi:hypothetical protein